MHTNLLSVGKITDQNFKVVFEKEKVKIIDENLNTILIADRRDGLYYLRKTEDDAFNANVEIIEENDESAFFKGVKKGYRSTGDNSQ